MTLGWLAPGCAGDQQQLRPRRRDAREGLLGQSVDSHHQIVWTQQNIEDADRAGPRARDDYLLYSDNCPPGPGMTQTEQHHLQRLAACGNELEAHPGYLNAFEYGLRAAIISHPRPEALVQVRRAMCFRAWAKRTGDTMGPSLPQRWSRL